MVDLSSIRNAPIFEGIEPSEIRELERIARIEPTAKGDCLFGHGDAADTFYVVADGKFALTVQVRALDEEFEIPIEEKRVGEAFGWSALVEPHRSIYSAYCTERGSVVAFSRADLEDLLASNPSFGQRFLHNLNQLIGSRIPPLLELWIEEIERSIERVEYWSRTKLADEWADAVGNPRNRALLGRDKSS